MFVGNIAFDIDEQKVIEELSAVGKVVSFRMMYDKSTGKSKGYGFCEYESPLIAETAMRTLKISFNGRPVKINYAENDLPNKPKVSPSKQFQIENITSVLDAFDEDNLKEVVTYLKRMAIDQPSQLKDLLDCNPSLVVSILIVLLKLKLVDKSKISELVSSSFDVEAQKEQIFNRIANVNENEIQEFSEEIKSKIVKLKYILNKSK